MTKELVEFEKQAAIAAMQTLISEGETDIEWKAMEYATSLVEAYKLYHPTVNDGDFVVFAIVGEKGRYIAIMKEDDVAHAYVCIVDDEVQLITPCIDLKEDYERYLYFSPAEKSDRQIILNALKEKGLCWDSQSKRIALTDECDRE